jgi:hypothetical protein
MRAAVLVEPGRNEMDFAVEAPDRTRGTVNTVVAVS